MHLILLLLALLSTDPRGAGLHPTLPGDGASQGPGDGDPKTSADQTAVSNDPAQPDDSDSNPASPADETELDSGDGASKTGAATPALSAPHSHADPSAGSRAQDADEPEDDPGDGGDQEPGDGAGDGASPAPVQSIPAPARNQAAPAHPSAPPAPPKPTTAGPVDAACVAIRSLAKASKLPDGAVSFYARDEDGTVRCDLNGAHRLNPASVTKLFTAVAALETLGPDHRFATSVLRKGDQVCLRGGGDPELDARELSTLANAAAQADKAQVTRLFVDLGLFDDQSLPPVYDQKRTDAPYRTLTGALAYRDGTFFVKALPGKKARRALRLTTDPVSDYFQIENGTSTGAKGGTTLKIKVRAGEGTARVIASGQMRAGKGQLLVKKAIPGPDSLSIAIFKESLLAIGVASETLEVKRHRCPEGLDDVKTLESEPVEHLVRRMLLESNNFIAETLLRHLGKDCQPKTFRCGLKEMRRAATRHGVKRQELRLKNGSGLYDANRVSSKTVVEFLADAMKDEALRKVLERGLPVSGETGTLRGRLPSLKGRVHAKTGTLDGVSALSGYLTDGPRRTWFSVIVNAPGVPVGNIRSFQDKAVKLLAAGQENVLTPPSVPRSKAASVPRKKAASSKRESRHGGDKQRR